MAYWSNIYCQIIGATGPVIGEGLLEGWWTSIELEGFSWSIESQEAADEDKKQSFVDSLKKAAETAMPIRKIKHVTKGNELKIQKRFDIASSELHLLMDQQLPILSVSITVLHISPSGQSFHVPGFVLLATGCKIVTMTDRIQPSEKGMEIKEEVEIEYDMITITYLKPIPHVTAVPMPPFIYKKREPESKTPALP